MAQTIFAILLFLHCRSCIASISTTQLNEIQTGTQLGQSLTAAMKPEVFPNYMATSPVTKILTFVKAAATVVDIIMKFVGTNESPELAEIKRLYNEMTQRFDSIDIKLKQISTQITWAQSSIQFGAIEQNINTNFEHLQNIYLRPVSIKDNEKQRFIDAFKYSCLNCATNLYHGIMASDSLITGDIMHRAMESLKYDRKKMQTFMIGILQLLAKGVASELVYDKLVNGEIYFHTYMNEWRYRLQNVTDLMVTLDSRVKNKWYDQANTDINDISVQYRTQSNTQFSSTLYNFLRDKYYWRDWFVLVYNDITDSNKHYNHACNGYKKYKLNGRNIVIATVDKSKPPIDKTAALKIIDAQTTFLALPSRDCAYMNFCVPWTTYTDYKAIDVFNRLPEITKTCSPYASVGVIVPNTNFRYRAPSERLVQKVISDRNPYSLHLFG